MTRASIGLAVLAVALSVLHASADEAAQKELAPTGKLRIAIAIGHVASTVYTTRDQARGQYRGVVIDLGSALAKALGVPSDFVVYQSTGEITAAANAGTWDVTFMPVDSERKAIVDFGAPYYVFESTYLAAPGSPVKTLAEANTPAVRIAAVANTVNFRASSKASPNAAHVVVPDIDAAVGAVRDGKADLMVLGRDSLVEIATKIPSARVLDGAILSTSTAIAVPKNKPAALAYVTAFIEQEKAAGNVRRYLDAVGLKNAIVAPAGMKP